MQEVTVVRVLASDSQVLLRMIRQQDLGNLNFQSTSAKTKGRSYLYVPLRNDDVSVGSKLKLLISDAGFSEVDNDAVSILIGRISSDSRSLVVKDPDAAGDLTIDVRRRNEKMKKNVSSSLPVDHSQKAVSDFDKILNYLNENLSGSVDIKTIRHLHDVIPMKWERLGDILIVKDTDAANLWMHESVLRLWFESMKLLKVRCVCVDHGSGISGELRIPSSVECIWKDGHFAYPKGSVGSSEVIQYASKSVTATLHIENGVKYFMDVSKVMFASGNGTERMHFGKLNLKDEVIVDMFAGIGYFSVPVALYTGAAKIYSLEKNEDSCELLRINRILNCVEKNVTVIQGDNRLVGPQGVANRVLMGYIPTPKSFLKRAVQFLLPEGGFIHYHYTAVKSECVSVLSSHFSEELPEYLFEIVSVRTVKSYRPHVFHFVGDVKVRKIGVEGIPLKQTVLNPSEVTRDFLSEKDHPEENFLSTGSFDFDAEKMHVTEIMYDESQDKSRAGAVDVDIRTFLNSLNGLKDYFSVSSCSGRVILVRQFVQAKASYDVEWIWVDHTLPFDCDSLLQKIAETHDFVAAKKKRKVRLRKKLPASVMPSSVDVGTHSTQTVSSPEGAKPLDSAQPDSQSWLKVEPPIVAVCCRDLASAQLLLDVCRRAGFKNPAIRNTSGKIMVAITDTQRIETLVALNRKVLLSGEYLKILVGEGTKKLEKSRLRLERLRLEMLKSCAPIRIA